MPKSSISKRPLLNIFTEGEYPGLVVGVTWLGGTGVGWGVCGLIVTVTNIGVGVGVDDIKGVGVGQYRLLLGSQELLPDMGTVLSFGLMMISDTSESLLDMGTGLSFGLKTISDTSFCWAKEGVSWWNPKRMIKDREIEERNKTRISAFHCLYRADMVDILGLV